MFNTAHTSNNKEAVLGYLRSVVREYIFIMSCPEVTITQARVSGDA